MPLFLRNGDIKNNYHTDITIKASIAREEKLITIKGKKTHRMGGYLMGIYVKGHDHTEKYYTVCSNDTVKYITITGTNNDNVSISSDQGNHQCEHLAKPAVV